MEIVLPKKSAFSIETPLEFPKLHQLMGVVAPRGCGKSVITASFLHALKASNLLDRLFIISPTYGSNEAIFGSLEPRKQDIYLDPSKEALNDITQKVEEEAMTYAKFEKEHEIWRLVRDLGGKAPIDLRQKYRIEPKSRYGHKPILHLIVDDAQGTSIYGQSTKNPFINLCLRHRHIGNGLGLSIYMLVQSYSSPSGIPRSIRQNLTMLLLGRQKSRKTLEQVADELGGVVADEDFFRVYNEAHKDDSPHDFLTIDFAPKKPEMRFRRNLNQFLPL